jgi:hypothetical protein
MNKLLITVFLLCTYGTNYAEHMDIKVNQQSIQLPYWLAQDPHYGGVILVRGGEPAQWSESLTQLALLLAKNGWSTVLLNSSPETTIPWIALLPEVMSTLRQSKNKRIVLIHYGEQLNVTLDYFSKPQGKSVNGLVLLSAYDDNVTAAKSASLRFPIFDVAGQFDYDNVTGQRDERAELFQSATYAAMQIPGADHDYNYAKELLVSFLSGWMLKIPESTVSAPPIKVKPAVRQSYIEPLNLRTLVAVNKI